MRPGYIYIMEDPLNCNHIKVGHTNDPVNRLRQLHTTSRASPFYINYLWGVRDTIEAEKIAHDVLASHRISSDREFFYIVPEWSDLPGDKCSDSCRNYLYSLAQLIEAAFDAAEIGAAPINIKEFNRTYYEGVELFPEGVKGFC